MIFHIEMYFDSIMTILKPYISPANILKSIFFFFVKLTYAVKFYQKNEITNLAVTIHST